MRICASRACPWHLCALQACSMLALRTINECSLPHSRNFYTLLARAYPPWNLAHTIPYALSSYVVKKNNKEREGERKWKRYPNRKRGAGANASRNLLGLPLRAAASLDYLLEVTTSTHVSHTQQLLAHSASLAPRDYPPRDGPSSCLCCCTHDLLQLTSLKLGHLGH